MLVGTANLMIVEISKIITEMRLRSFCFTDATIKGNERPILSIVGKPQMPQGLRLAAFLAEFVPRFQGLLTVTKFD